MAWIESHQSLRNHPKTLKAAKLLGISGQEVIGYLHFLWWWAEDYAPDGDLTPYSIADLEMAVEWRGEAGTFIQALIDCGYGNRPGFLERDGDNILIHDWYEYAGKLIEKREEDKQRKRAQRKKTSIGHPQDIPKTSAGNPEDGARTAQVHTIPTIHTTPTTPAPDADIANVVTRFGELGGVWPEKTDRRTEAQADLRNLCRTYGAPKVLDALEYGDKKKDDRGLTIPFVTGILERWAQARASPGIGTPGAAAELRATLEQAKAAKQRSTKEQRNGPERTDTQAGPSG